MASRHIMPKEVMLAKFGNIMLDREDNIYCLSEVEAISLGIENIVVETRESAINPDVCSLKNLVSSGIALAVFVQSFFRGSSVTHKWIRNGEDDLWKETYSEEP